MSFDRTPLLWGPEKKHSKREIRFTMNWNGQGVILYHVYIIHIIIFLDSFILTWQSRNRLSCSPHWSKINHAHLSSECLLCLAFLSKLLLKPSMSVSGELFLFKRQESREPSTHTTTATNRN